MQLELGQTPSTNGGGSSALRGIVRYEFRYKVGSGSYGNWQNVPGGASARSHTLTDLDVGVKHTFQLRARNGYGSVVYSGEVSATPLARAAITDIDIETEPTAIGSFSGFHGTGDFIQVRVTFSRDVLGTPESGVASLKLLVGGKERTAQAQFTQLPLRSFVFVYTASRRTMSTSTASRCPPTRSRCPREGRSRTPTEWTRC